MLGGNFRGNGGQAQRDGGRGGGGGGGGGYQSRGGGGNQAGGQGRGGYNQGHQNAGRGGGGFRGSRGGGRGGGRGGSPSVPRPNHIVIPTNKLPERTGEVRIVGKSEFVTRPGYGKNYVKYITLVSNHFLVTAKGKIETVYHYDVDIAEVRNQPSVSGDKKRKPPSPKPQNGPMTKKLAREVNVKIIEKLRLDKCGPNDLFYNVVAKRPILPVFDGQKNLYTAVPLNGIGKKAGAKTTERIVLADEPIKNTNGFNTQFVGGTFDVTITATATCEVDLRPALYYTSNADVASVPQEAILALNIIIRYAPSMSQITVGQNSLFPMNGQRHDLGEGVELLTGHYQSVRPTATGLNLIVDKKAGAFYPNKSAIGYIAQCLRMDVNEQTLFRELADSSRRQRYSSFFRGLNLNTFHVNGQKRTFKKCAGLTDVPLQSLSVEGGSLINYFREKYEIDLRHVTLPCLVFKRQGGNDVKLPLELCFLAENQRVPGKLNPDQTANMITYTATPPETRFNEIYNFEKGVRDLGVEYLAEFDLDLSLQPLRVPGKVRQTPKICYGGSKEQPVAGKGSWNTGRKLFQTVEIKNWLLVNMDNRYRNAANFAKALNSKCIDMGLRTAGAPTVMEENYNGRRTLTKIFDEAKKRKAELIIWIAGTNLDTQVYSDIKYLGESNTRGYGILSQFLKTKTIDQYDERRLGMTLGNIVLKINAKLGGINQLIDDGSLPQILKKGKRTMIIGADVTHHTPGDRTEKSVAGDYVRVDHSIAALVGTLDDTYFNYATSTRVQLRERLEIITQFDEMLAEVIRPYYVKNRCLPDHIIYYRDGVSEGQFNEVLQKEIGLMQKLFLEVLPKNLAHLRTNPYKPKITVIIVQKRHHTRIRPQFEEDGVGRMSNVPAGTTCDTTITQFRDFDYFLASHEGIQGTTKPSHYYVIRDDNKFSPDDMFDMTFYLAHTYAKCSRSISVSNLVC